VNAKDPVGTKTVFGGAYSTVRTVDNIAYIGTRSGLFKIFDVSVPSSPMFIGEININASIVDIDIVDDYAYVADNSKGATNH